MSWLTLEETKLHLGKDNTSDDEELYGFIEAAEAMIDDLIGTVRPSTTPRDEWHGGACDVVILDKCPVAAVVAVYVNGTIVPQADLDDTSSLGWYASDIDMGGGLIRHTSYFSSGRVKVQYHPGRLVIRGNVRLAGLELVLHLWSSSQRGSSGSKPSYQGGTTDEPIVFRGYALPNRVRELLGLGKRATDEQLIG